MKRYVSTEDTGLLNSFAVEPKMYVTEAPNDSDKRNYVIIAVGSVVFVGAFIGFAAFVSSMS